MAAAASAKGKAVLAVSIAPPAEEADADERGEEGSPAAALPQPKMPARNASSKYDFVKIPNHVAVKIALELKKLLIDNSLLDVSQSDLEANLFKLMVRRGYGEEYINRYKMMTRFHHQRVPLVILVCGTACTGKSTIATQLAQRLNLPNVLQTEMVYELLRTSTDAPLASVPVWAREFDTPEELITEFCRECRIVRKGLAGDLKKAMKDGKPIIIEGIHLDPSIYLMDEEHRESVDLPKTNKESDGNSEDNILRQTKENAGTIPSGVVGSHSTTAHDSEDTHSHETGSQKETSAQVTVQMYSSITGGPEKTPDFQGDNSKDRDSKMSSSVKKEKPPAEPIIVPIVLKMAEFDHKALLEEWISTRTFGDKYLIQDQQKLMSSLKTIQDYLCSFEAQGLMVVNISATTFPQTLDRLHNYLLECIERGVSTSPDENKHSEQS